MTVVEGAEGDGCGVERADALIRCCRSSASSLLSRAATSAPTSSVRCSVWCGAAGGCARSEEAAGGGERIGVRDTVVGSTSRRGTAGMPGVLRAALGGRGRVAVAVGDDDGPPRRAADEADGRSIRADSSQQSSGTGAGASDRIDSVYTRAPSFASLLLFVVVACGRAVRRLAVLCRLAALSRWGREAALQRGRKGGETRHAHEQRRHAITQEKRARATQVGVERRRMV